MGRRRSKKTEEGDNYHMWGRRRPGLNDNFNWTVSLQFLIAADKRLRNMSPAEIIREWQEIQREIRAGTPIDEDDHPITGAIWEGFAVIKEILRACAETMRALMLPPEKDNSDQSEVTS
jgi:hypothetical protein